MPHIKFWEIKDLKNGHFIAEATKDNILCWPEQRIYYSRYALERDFGPLRCEPENGKEGGSSDQVCFTGEKSRTAAARG
jgi:hypothetical protein